MHINKPPYQHFPVLYSDNIIMREILPGDIKDIIEISVYDGKYALTELDAIKIQNRIDKDYHDGNSIHWGITDREKNIIVGTCGYYRGFDNDTGELGCIMRQEFRGLGYMTSAIKLAVNFGLNDMRLKRIIAITNKNNVKALGLLARLQFDLSSDFNNGTLEFKYNPF
jgi:ribosomal-protein-alanine N-acetyltransferase